MELAVTLHTYITVNHHRPKTELKTIGDTTWKLLNLGFRTKGKDFESGKRGGCDYHDMGKGVKITDSQYIACGIDTGQHFIHLIVKISL